MSKTLERQTKAWDELAQAVLERAESLGVAAEVKFSTSDSLTVKVRKGELEELRQSAPSGVSLRVFAGKRAVSGASSHVDRKALLALVERLAENAKLVDEDDANGLPDKELLFAGEAELDLFDSELAGVTVDQALDMARRAEQAAFAVDKRITNSSGSSVGIWRGMTGLYNSYGTRVSMPTSGISLSVSPLAEDPEGNKYSDGWWATSRHLADLADVEQVGRTAGERCVALIGAGKVPTGEFPVLFAPETARDLVDLVFQCVSGDAVYKDATFLAEKEGEPIASKLFTLVDDPLRKRGLSSRAFDSEGVATRRQVVVDQGVLKFFPCDSFSARRLERRSTGHAGGGGVASTNLYVEKGETPAAELPGRMGTGLLVTAFIGFSFNRATGDFSRGVRGFWIEDGTKVRPVQEITVSGNLGTMLQDIIAVGDDLQFRFGTDSPSLLIKKMTVSGS